MKKKVLFTVATLLLFYVSVFGQTGGILVELKPFNPPTQPPIGGITTPPDTIIEIRPCSEKEKINFSCYKESSYLSLQCNENEQVEIVIYEMLSGVKYTSTLNMVAGEVYTINTPWSAGLYTIRLILTDGTILEGDFQIR